MWLSPTLRHATCVGVVLHHVKKLSPNADGTEDEKEAADRPSDDTQSHIKVFKPRGREHRAACASNTRRRPRSLSPLRYLQLTSRLSDATDIPASPSPSPPLSHL